MQLSILLRKRAFWLGVGLGSLTTILFVISLSLVWVLRAKHQVEERMDDDWKEYQSKTRPLLKPPPIPDGTARRAVPTGADLKVNLSGWTLKTLNGETIRGVQLEGEPVFINFWATWCEPCIAELPSIQKLADSAEAEAHDLRILLVTDEDKEEVERFFAVRDDLRGLPVALAYDGIPAEIWFRARPETSIIACDGEVILRHRGPADWADPRFRTFLSTSLRRSCKTSSR